MLLSASCSPHFSHHRMKIPEIIASLEELTKAEAHDEFVFGFLRAFGIPKATITLLQKGQRNVTPRSKPAAILLKNKLFFESVLKGESPREVLESDRQERSILRQKPRFLVVTNFETIAAYDTKRDEEIEAPFSQLAEQYAFFLPLAGLEIAQHTDETGVDVKAATKMAKLYDLICETNEVATAEERHAINLFLTRLLFCYFAEDTGIFEDNAFTEAVDSYTQADASDLQEFLTALFRVLNLPPQDAGRGEVPVHLSNFPYVNGNLFAGTTDAGYSAPRFTAKARRQLIELGGSLDWSEINPDIFGSMFQGVIDPEVRHNLGMHYTSVPNIMKVIVPLFLEELYDDLDKALGSEKKLQALHTRLTRIQIFDPACGSGNFLIIAYRELRRLEMEIFKALDQASGAQELRMPRIHVNQFYGIEVSDFAAEVAVLAMWLAEHQMNVQFKATFGGAPAALPLQDGANVVCENATRIAWDGVCPQDEALETYLLGNPPYTSYSKRTKAQQRELVEELAPIRKAGRADYISIWFKKASEYISGHSSKFGFVTTNSLVQGEHVSMIWPYLLSNDREIFYAHTAFKWKNNAKEKAGVTCVIICMRNQQTAPKRINDGSIIRSVSNISPYLVEGNTLFLEKRKVPLSFQSSMYLGSSPIEGGNLLLSGDERSNLIAQFPGASQWVKRFSGGNDWLYSKIRHCLWVGDSEIEAAAQIPLIRDRIEKCREWRKTGGRDAKKAASVPHRFFYRKHQELPSYFLPMTSSENRKYVTVGFDSGSVVFSNGVCIISNPEKYLLSVLSSRMHMVWVEAVAGGLETRIRYSTALCYNNFPFPQIKPAMKDKLATLGEDVLNIRDNFPLKTIAELYDSSMMPMDLIATHQANDEAVERCYRKRPFNNDEERLEHLFKLYEEMVVEAQSAS